MVDLKERVKELEEICRKQEERINELERLVGLTVAKRPPGCDLFPEEEEEQGLFPTPLVNCPES